MGGVVNDWNGSADHLEQAEQAYQRLVSALALIERANPAVLRELRECLEVEIMIDRSSRPRRQLLRHVSELCDRRIREKEGDVGPGALRGRISGWRRPPAGEPRAIRPV
jgi:hypothetical protein